MNIPLVKVCCISSLGEAQDALDAGANLLGLVSEMPSGPGVISLDRIASIVQGLPLETNTVLLTSKTKARDIIRQHKLVNTWGIQLVDKVAPGEIKSLRKSLSSTCLIQVIHVHGLSSVDEAISYASLVDYLLLDSGNPKGKLKTLGGTGKTHDWQVSREICAKSTVPVFLAGGLNHTNVRPAISTVQPDGVDVCSGVRNRDQLSPTLLSGFMNQVKENL